MMQQQQDPISRTTAEMIVSSWFEKTPQERIDILFEVKNILEKEKSQCLVERNRLVKSLKTEREIHRKINIPLMEKLNILQREMRQERNQSRNLFQKLKKENEILLIKSNINNGVGSYYYPGVENYSRYTVTRFGMSPLAGDESLKPEYGPVYNDVTLLRYPLTISPCQNGNVSVKQNSVFIAVISAPGNFDKRNTIRRTWRNHLKIDYHNSSMRLAGFAFILGLTDHNETQMKIKEEATTYGDVIQIEMADFYRNLSLKVAGLFNWLYKYCHHKTDFLFKVDDDVYVNVRNLVQFVQTFHESNESMFGLSAVSSLKPIRGL